MSSISSIGGGIDLSQLYQSVSGTSQSGAASPTNDATSTSATGGAAIGQQVHGHHHHGQKGGGNSQLFQQLQSAVSSALQSAGQGGTDPNQAIEDAITKVFQNNNSAASPNSGTTSQTADPDAASANTPASTTASTTESGGSSSLQAFFQTLQSAGINPQQFHQDFLTAVQNAQNGNVNPSQAFQSLPPGSIIDTTG